MADLQLERHSLSTIIESSILNTNVPNYVKIHPPNNSSTIICDAYKLEIVFSNLLNNSIQAMDGEGEIKIKISDEKSSARIDIIDSGTGIPEDVLPKIFEPLFTTKQVGTGLGLASCKSIIEKHGGSISVRNNPTTFSIILPKTTSNQKKTKKMLTQEENLVKNPELKAQLKS